MLNKYTSSVIFSLLLIATFSSNAQNTIVLQPDGNTGIDAFVSQLNPSANYGYSTEFITYAWTFSGQKGLGKSLLKFDLNAIPSNATIVSAKLSLYHNPDVNGSAGQAGNNASLLKKITSKWVENTVTWNNFPSSTSSGAIYLQSSTSPNQDYTNIDITAFVNDWYQNPGTNYGVELAIIDTNIYNSMKFASSDFYDSNKRPKLEITYSLGNETCIILRPDGIQGKDARIHEMSPYFNNPDQSEFITYDWTFSGTRSLGKSLIEFDLSAIPNNVQISNAYLSLYHSGNSGSDGQAGENKSFLKKITSPWQENSVTWATAPSTTATGAITLDKSTSPVQDYLNINVTDFVKDWYLYPNTNNGMMLELVNNTLYSSMKFGSSDIIDSTKRPKLQVCYIKGTGIDEFILEPIVTVYPNPSKDFIIIKNNKDHIIDRIEIIGIDGKKHLEITENLSSTQEIDISSLSQGLYLINIVSNKNSYSSKFIKIK